MKLGFDVMWEYTGERKASPDQLVTVMQWIEYLRHMGYLRGCGAWIDAKGGLVLLKARTYNEARALCKKAPLFKIGKVEIHARHLYDAA